MSRWPFRSWRKPSSCSRVSTTPAGRSCRPPTWPAHSKGRPAPASRCTVRREHRAGPAPRGYVGAQPGPQQLRRRPTGQRGDTAQARPLLEESLTLRRSLGGTRGGDDPQQPWRHRAAGGRADRAARLFAEQLALAQQAGLVLHTSWGLTGLGLSAAAYQDDEGAPRRCCGRDSGWPTTWETASRPPNASPAWPP